ncbi:hypothetical protein [Desulfonatronospira sp.]|uniref:hypothetical protein n=1 Tax=Desulfonatronospira sp. TaxID=1962951 RepID=UPI0025B9AE3B|nr:hypothetical protein [Desulfonatronospira sp.]
MLTYLFYISIILLITYFVVYYLSGLYFKAKKQLRQRKDISYFEEEVRRLEVEYNKEHFNSLDSQHKKELEDRLQRYRETLNYLKNSP